MTDAELKEKMEERQMCEEAPGVVPLFFIPIWTLFSHFGRIFAIGVQG